MARAFANFPSFSQSSLPKHSRKYALLVCMLIGLAVIVCCSDEPNPTKATKKYVLPAALTLYAHAVRTDDGGVVVLGTTNLPDGLKMWIEVQSGHLPLGAPRVIASDDNVVVNHGKFASKPLWKAVPNTRFTRKGWPSGVEVNERLKPFPEGKLKVHFESMFLSTWQTAEVLKEIGGEDGKRLKGSILKAIDPDVIDSPMAVDCLLELPVDRISLAGKAINLVRAAILTVPGEGRSAGDVQANLDLYLSSPGLSHGKGWAAKAKGPSDYEVSYGFIDGGKGEQEAIWRANLKTDQVRYENEYGKMFSWTPNY